MPGVCQRERPMFGRAAKLAAAVAAILGATAFAAEAGGQRVSIRYGYYQVVAVHSNMCLDVAGGALADKATLIQASCSGAASQQWMVDNESDGSYRLRSQDSG